jgi:outer membrane protein assembly factor BamE (lipoprotein component of BamABCDE complex)
MSKTSASSPTRRMPARLLPAALLAAALAAGAGTALAAPHPAALTHQDETRVSLGMTQDQVRQALGRPERAMHFAASDSTTWTYALPAEEETVFDVDFDASGHVSSIEERYVPLE